MHYVHRAHKIHTSGTLCRTDMTGSGNNKGSGEIIRSLIREFCAGHCRLAEREPEDAAISMITGISKGLLCEEQDLGRKCRIRPRRGGQGPNQDAPTQPLCAKVFTNCPESRLLVNAGVILQSGLGIGFFVFFCICNFTNYAKCFFIAWVRYLCNKSFCHCFKSLSSQFY